MDFKEIVMFEIWLTTNEDMFLKFKKYFIKLPVLHHDHLQVFSILSLPNTDLKFDIVLPQNH